MSIIAALKNEVKGLFPAYFALVMSTGIISIGAHLLNMHTVSNWLFWLNNIAYGMLLLFLLFRILFYFKSFVSDLTSFKKSPGFFTVIAGSCILGTQYALLKHDYGPASILFWFGVGTWLLLIYTFFIVITTESDKPNLEKGISGVWLVVVVATQSIAVLGTTLDKHLPFTTEQVLFMTISAFLLGTILYIILITLIFYRLTFFKTEPEEVSPPYWINMGAMAITTLAGDTLIQHISSSPAFADLLPFVKGITMLAWATATWWIPIIVMLEIWKYFVKKVQFSYSPKLWSAVFCLGMYTTATFKLSMALKAPYLLPISEAFIYLSLVVWGLVLIGMLSSAVKTLATGNTTASTN